jgi:hypothetical protein
MLATLNATPQFMILFQERRLFPADAYDAAADSTGCSCCSSNWKKGRKEEENTIFLLQLLIHKFLFLPRSQTDLTDCLDLCPLENHEIETGLIERSINSGIHIKSVSRCSDVKSDFD